MRQERNRQEIIKRNFGIWFFSRSEMDLLALKNCTFSQDQTERTRVQKNVLLRLKSLKVKIFLMDLLQTGARVIFYNTALTSTGWVRSTVLSFFALFTRSKQCTVAVN